VKFDLTTKENLEMFRRAWSDAGAVPGLNIEESTALWFKRFGCRMIYGKSGFIVAEFDDEKDAIMFILKWS
jgi:hypothetical protein